MKNRWKKTLVGGGVGLLLVGCSILSVQHPPRHDAGYAARAGRSVQPADFRLEPGPSHLTVGRVGADHATIWWQSPWAGKSVVRYGKQPQLLPPVASLAPASADHTALLAQLDPDTRYYFQIETETSLGYARSAVCSFRTR